MSLYITHNLIHKLGEELAMDTVIVLHSPRGGIDPPPN